MNNPRVAHLLDRSGLQDDIYVNRPPFSGEVVRYVYKATCNVAILFTHALKHRKNSNVTILVTVRSIYGQCPTNSRAITTLRGMGFAMGRKRVITVLNPSKSKGSALVGILKYLSAPATNACRLTKRMISNIDRRTLSSVHHHAIKFIFRNFRLLPRLATLRGARLPLICQKVPTTRHQRTTVSDLHQMKLRRQLRRQPSRLSNNRRRQITVTQTVINQPQLLLTSRPANGLSATSNHRIVALLHRLRTTNRAIIVVARSPTVKTTYPHQIVVRSNGLERN